MVGCFTHVIQTILEFILVVIMVIVDSSILVLNSLVEFIANLVDYFIKVFDSLFGRKK